MFEGINLLMVMRGLDLTTRSILFFQKRAFGKYRGEKRIGRGDGCFNEKGSDNTKREGYWEARGGVRPFSL